MSYTWQAAEIIPEQTGKRGYKSVNIDNLLLAKKILDVDECSNPLHEVFLDGTGNPKELCIGLYRPLEPSDHPLPVKRKYDRRRKTLLMEVNAGEWIQEGASHFEPIIYSISLSGVKKIDVQIVGNEKANAQFQMERRQKYPTFAERLQNIFNFENMG